MNHLTRAKMSRQLVVNDLEQEQRCLERADGIAYAQSKDRLIHLKQCIADLDVEIRDLTESELFAKDSKAAIDRAVQISQIKMIQALLIECWSGANNEAGLTTTRYVMIGNELSRALKELEA